MESDHSWAYRLARGDESSAAAARTAEVVVEMANDYAVVRASDSLKLVYQEQGEANKLANGGVTRFYNAWGTEWQLYNQLLKICRTPTIHYLKNFMNI